NYKEDRLTAFNLLPYERNEVVTTEVITKLSSFELKDFQDNTIPFELIDKTELDPGLIDRQIVHYGNYDPFYKYTVQLKDHIPAMGYKTYYIVDCDQTNYDTTFEEKDVVETDFYRISVNSNGTLNIFDKENQEEYQNVLLLENGGDDGDEYDYSPLLNEKLIYSTQLNAENKIVQNQFETHIRIHLTLPVPSDLEYRKAGKRDSKVTVDWNITIPNHKAWIKIEAEIDNQARDHRLRACIPTSIASKFSVSDNQFGYSRRDVYDSAMDIWEKENWNERPDSIYPMLSYVGLSDDRHGLSVLTNSTREYEIVGENYDTIAKIGRASCRERA